MVVCPSLAFEPLGGYWISTTPGSRDAKFLSRIGAVRAIMVQARSMALSLLHEDVERHGWAMRWMLSLLGPLPRRFLCPSAPSTSTRSSPCKLLDISALARRRLWMGRQAPQVSTKAHAESSTTPAPIAISATTSTASRAQRKGQRQRALGTYASIYAMACAASSSFAHGSFCNRTFQFAECNCIAFNATISQAQGRQGRDGVELTAENAQGFERETHSSGGHQGGSCFSRSNLAEGRCEISQAAGRSFESCSQEACRFGRAVGSLPNSVGYIHRQSFADVVVTCGGLPARREQVCREETRSPATSATNPSSIARDPQENYGWKVLK